MHLKVVIVVVDTGVDAQVVRIHKKAKTA